MYKELDNHLTMVKVILGILFLLSGGSIYLLHRSTGIVLFRVVDALGCMDTVEALRASVATLPEFVVFSLPDGLWSASYLLFVDAVFASQSKSIRLVWGALIPAIGLASELLQAIGFCPGTPDWQDALCYGVPYILYVIWLEVAAAH
ncbi:MAG: hypothetical protein J6W56_10215 [Prevotella sp.]|nr:hypothetical protein [Prevotella sp.]